MCCVLWVGVCGCLFVCGNACLVLCVCVGVVWYDYVGVWVCGCVVVCVFVCGLVCVLCMCVIV